MLLDNIDVAILSKYNELAERFGIKAYECLATLDHSKEMDGRGLSFVVPGETDDERVPSIKKMLNTLGVSINNSKHIGLLKGGEIAVIDALDRALALAPKQRPRI
jgi:hypothetical protein